MIDKERSRKIRVELRKVLAEQWDPIGRKGILAASCEYDMYIGGVYDLLARRASDQEIADHLHTIETERMGLSQLQKGRLMTTAKALRVTFDRWEHSDSLGVSELT